MVRFTTTATSTPTRLAGAASRAEVYKIRPRAVILRPSLLET